MTTTLLNKLVDPEVLGDLVSAKLPARLSVLPFAKVDNTLVAQPGSTITVPVWGYIGDAKDYEENTPIDASEMSTTTSDVSVKKIGKAVALTDEAVLSGVGNPVGEAGTQLTKSLASKMDADVISALLSAPTDKYYVDSFDDNGDVKILSGSRLLATRSRGLGAGVGNARLV